METTDRKRTVLKETRRVLWLPAVAVFLFGCSGPQSAIDPAGPYADHIDGLWWLMFYLLSAVFLIVIALVIVASLRKRSQPEPSRSVIVDDPLRERRMTRNVIAGVGLTVIILFILLGSSFFVGRAIYTQPVGITDALTIEVTGHQWWWAVRYNNPAPSRTFNTANEIHIPVGQPVLIKLISTDVIHSFWVPNLNGKTDLIPGHPAEMWLRADRPGIYRGQCAEFCGHQHAHMAFAVVAEAEDQFRAWYDNQVKSSPVPVTSTQIRGQQVFLSKPCVMCHRIQGTDAGGNVGPDLTHVGSRLTIASGTLENTREHLAKWVSDAQQVKPGNRMPPNPMNEADLNALLDYLQSLK